MKSKEISSVINPVPESGQDAAQETRIRVSLSDKEIGNLLAAFGNHEGKAITYGLMRSKTAYSMSAINSQLLHSQGEDPMWVMHPTTVFAYCETFYGIGGIVEETNNSDMSTAGYIKTDYGEQTGDPLAGLLLDFSLRHPDFALQDFFGITSSNNRENPNEDKKRAPLRRLKILREIASVDLSSTTTQDIAWKLNDPIPVVSRHLSALSESRLIQYESVAKAKPISLYRIAEDPPETDPPGYSASKKGNTYTQMTQDVYRILKEIVRRDWFGVRDIADVYLREKGKNPEELTDNYLKNIDHNVANILSHLSKLGYAERGKFKRGNIIRKGKQSEVSLDEEQKAMIEEVVSIIDRFQNQDSEIITLGRRALGQILADPKAVKTLLKKAKEHSANARGGSSQENEELVLSLLRMNPDSTVKEVRIMMKVSGKSLRPDTVRRIFRTLVDRGEINFTAERDIRRYSTPDASLDS